MHISACSKFLLHTHECVQRQNTSLNRTVRNLNRMLLVVHINCVNPASTHEFTDTVEAGVALVSVLSPTTKKTIGYIG